MVADVRCRCVAGNEPRSQKFGYMPSGKTYANDCARLKGMVHSAYAGAALVPKVVCGDW